MKKGQQIKLLVDFENSYKAFKAGEVLTVKKVKKMFGQTAIYATDNCGNEIMVTTKQIEEI